MSHTPPPTRISLVTPNAHYNGGVEQVNRLLLHALEARGMGTEVVCRDALRGRPALGLAAKLLGLNRALARHFNAEVAPRTDAVICNGEFGLGVRHASAINVFHGSYLGYARAMRPYVSSRTYGSMLRLADEQRRAAAGKLVVSVSDWLAGILADQDITVDFVIPNAVETDRFTPDSAVLSNGRCLFVGSPNRFGKGFDILEEMATRGVAVDCVTDVRPRDPRLGWLGAIDNEALPAVYRRCDALVFPSRFEGCGLVPLEAMACGTPVVMTRVGNAQDIQRDIPEFVVDGPSDTLADRMVERLEILADRRGEFSTRAREYVERHHGLRRWEDRWNEVIHVALERGGR